MTAPARSSRAEERETALVDLLDRLLDAGVVLAGDVVVSVADVPLLRVDLRVLVASVETAGDPW